MRALLLAAFLAAVPTLAAAQPGGKTIAAKCDRVCLEGFANRYMEALSLKDPSRLTWADKVRFSENNVMLLVGDGLWNTITGKPSNLLTFADPDSGNVGLFGVVEQHGAQTFYGMRLKVVDGKIAEVESLTNTPSAASSGAGAPADATAIAHYPQMSAILPADQRTPRLRMIDLANGYFSTLQLNDGKIFTTFSDDCRRKENASETAGNPAATRASGQENCGQQFTHGLFHFDSAVRDRSYDVVDEARGLVLARAFIDHNQAQTEFTLTDGTKMTSRARGPNTLCMLELFHITAGKIDRIEVVHISVPYAMPSVWRRAD